jgi:hypothetical protein
MPEHIVKSGETLSYIAKKYNVTCWQFIYWHPKNSGVLSDPDEILPGTKLYVPDFNASSITISAGRATQLTAARHEVQMAVHRVQSLTKKVEATIHLKLTELKDKVEVEASKHKKEIGHINAAATKYEKAKTAAGKVLEVKFGDIIDNKGLKANWQWLWTVWLLETTPSELGTWSTDGTNVIITRSDYTSDLRSRPQHAVALQKFKTEHPDFSKIKIGDTSSSFFQFTGEGTATGNYNAVEWFMGSYQIQMEVIRMDPASLTVTLKFVITNLSHWESATRTPKVFQNAGMPKYVLSDKPRSAFGPGGDFSQRFVWAEQLKYERPRRLSTS